MTGFRRRLLVAGAFAAALSMAVLPAALGANISLFTGPAGSNPMAENPPNLGTINQVINAVNAGVGGLLNAQTAAVGTGTGTAEQVLQQFTLPANQLGSAGQAVRITCWGTTAANANNKTMKLYFGASAIATPTAATNAKGWRLAMTVMRRTSTTQGVDSHGLVDVTPVTPANTDGAETLTAGVLIKCTGTDGTSSANDIVASGMIIEQLK